MCTRPGTRLHARLFKRSGERGSERCKGKKLFVPDCAYVVIISNGSREFTVRRRIGFGVVSENSVFLVNSSWIEDEFCPIFSPKGRDTRENSKFVRKWNGQKEIGESRWGTSRRPVEGAARGHHHLSHFI